MFITTINDKTITQANLEISTFFHQLENTKAYREKIEKVATKTYKLGWLGDGTYDIAESAISISKRRHFATRYCGNTASPLTIYQTFNKNGAA
ncbi:hypothetical protein D3C75_1181000 [compost metagenome]